MKTTTFFSTLLTGAFAFSGAAAKVDFNSLPDDLKKKIQVHSGSNRIEDIDHESRNGQMIYEVAFKQNGVHKELQFNEQGELLNADGSRAVPWAAAGAQASNTKTNFSSTPITISNGQKVEWMSIPENVRNSFYYYTPQARLEDIDKGYWNGKTVYEFAFKDQGKHVEVQMDESGQLIHDPRLIGTNKNAAASSAQAQPATLSAGYKIPWEQLPEQVRSAFLKHAPGARIEDIEGGNWQGKTVYQFGFKQNNQHVELQIDQSGQLVHDPRNSGSNAK